MNIVTLTLNPAFDIHCHSAQFFAGHENLATITDHEAGGKGVNISRALTRNRVENVALVVLGEENKESFERRLIEDGMCYRALCVSGRIRENITIHTDHDGETRISFPGFATDVSLLPKVEDAISDLLNEDCYVTFTGRVPAGLPMHEVKAFLRRLSARGARIVIDSRSFSLEDLVEMKPFLIKPNQEEISEYLGKEISTFAQTTQAARALYEQGIENVMISLGAQGALLVCSEGTYLAKPPKIEAKSTIGAGDSTIGGFLAAVVDRCDPGECLRRAVSYGTAACLSAGTRPPEEQDVLVIREQVAVEKMA